MYSAAESLRVKIDGEVRRCVLRPPGIVVGQGVWVPWLMDARSGLPGNGLGRWTDSHTCKRPFAVEEITFRDAFQCARPKMEGASEGEEG